MSTGRKRTNENSKTIQKTTIKEEQKPQDNLAEHTAILKKPKD